jgi:hypothetical protein
LFVYMVTRYRRESMDISHLQNSKQATDGNEPCKGPYETHAYHGNVPLYS